MLISLERLQSVNLRLQKLDGHEMLTLRHTFGDIGFIEIKLDENDLCVRLS
ncbi:hypothetical protein BLIC_b00733 [Bifidobacterium longum subsp. infantis]|nr:hypothetical protein BLIC_b00733 [Bifidobacterium longum subsp. infantis]